MTSRKILAVTAALALSATPVALAKKGGDDHPGQGKAKSELKGANGKHRGKGKSKLKTVVVHGTVLAVDETTITVAIDHANRAGRALGSEYTFALTAPVDAVAGDAVVVQSKKQDEAGVYVARKVKVKADEDADDEPASEESEAPEALPAE